MGLKIAGAVVGFGGVAISLPAHAQTDDLDAKQACDSFQTAKTTTFVTSNIKTTFVEASKEKPFTPPTTHISISKPFCRVEGIAKSNPDSNIKFELWLPAKDHWNGRFVGTASGGSRGQINYKTLAEHYQLDYASIAHDNGHVSTGYDQRWSYDAATKSLKMDAILDWSYRAMHVVTAIGKELTADYYKVPITFSYYDGCSQSGHHGMMEAQRFPDDYDGIIAGAHTSDWTTNMVSQAWAAYPQFRNGGAGALTKEMWALVHKAIVGQCAGKIDGLVDDPRNCAFDPASLLCKADATSGQFCLNPAQVETLRAVYQGHRTPTGELVAFPYALGSEVGLHWPNSATSPTSAQGSWADYFRYPVFVNPDYDFNSFDFDRDPLIAREKLSEIYDAYSTDLSAFQKHGGKLLMYHGWADSLISPFLSLTYYDALRKTMGPTVDSFARQFFVPGMDHCMPGNGAGNFSMLDALSNWVEKGVPPDATGVSDRIVGVSANGKFSRPLCPYPKIARYSGAGDVNVAASFICDAP